MGIVRMSLIHTTARVLLLCVAIFASLVLWRLLSSTRIAEAATDTYYPSFCLGGWDKPRHASGEPETGNGDDPDAFTAENSAFLEPDVSAQIYCGYFPVEVRDNLPIAADVRLVWNLVHADTVVQTPFATPPQPVSSTTDSTEQPAATDTPAQDSTPATQSALEPTTDPASTPPAEPSASAAPSEPSSAADTPAVVLPTAETPASQSDPALPPPPATAEPAATSPTSFIGNALKVAGSWVATHTPVAQAQENTAVVSLSDWFEVSYSLDGVRWRSLGRVNAQNWKDFTVHIPLSSWDDLQNVQIMVAALPSLSARPPVYLDAMELRVQTDASLSETASAAVSAANDVVNSAADAVSSLGTALVSLFTSSAAEPTVSQPAPSFASAAPAPKAKRRVLQFTISGASVPIPTHLPWQESDVRDNVASTTQSVMPSVARSDDGRSFIVSGSCTQAYAVVITYRNPNDYRDNPRDSIANVATECVGGRYTFNLGSLPVSTQGGTYYLLVGEQSATGTWTPSSALLPITIEPVEVEE